MKNPSDNTSSAEDVCRSSGASLPFWRDYFWPALIATIVFFASSQSEVAAPDIVGVDKIGHFIVFGWLGLLVARIASLRRATPLGPWLAVIVVSAYGGLDELHQSFTPGRSIDVVDWAVDTVGAACAVALYLNWTWARGWLEKPPLGEPD